MYELRFEYIVLGWTARDKRRICFERVIYLAFLATVGRAVYLAASTAGMEDDSAAFVRRACSGAG